MRQPFTTQQAFKRGLSEDALRWRVKTGQVQRLCRGVYIDGAEEVTAKERALGMVVATNGVASGALAGVLYGLDSVELKPPYATISSNAESRHHVRRADVDVVFRNGIPCTNGIQTLCDLAKQLEDTQWEQAMESALHKRIVTLDELNAASTKRIRRVMKLRPTNAPPTESLLETLAVQLIRSDSSLPTPARQVVVTNRWDHFVARVDLAWPEHGIFIELDGEHHKDQPVYDANRQTAVVAATGWLIGRFTWTEVNYARRATLNRLHELFEQTQAA